MSDIKSLTKKVVKFNEERNWRKFHNPKDLSISLALEAAEVLEHFQWKSPEEMEKYVKTNKSDLADELSDVLKYLLMLSYELKIDLVKSVPEKMKKDAKKYPAAKYRGKHPKDKEFE